MSLSSRCRNFIKRLSDRFFGAVLVGMSLLLSACGTGGDDVYVEAFPAMVSYDDVVKGSELMCLAEDRDEAEKTAEQYGIELVDFSYGVATFHTDEDLNTVIRKGKKNGWKELSINHYSKAF